MPCNAVTLSGNVPTNYAIRIILATHFFTCTTDFQKCLYLTYIFVVDYLKSITQEHAINSRGIQMFVFQF